MDFVRPIAQVEAHVPTNLVFNEQQIEGFGTPAELEANFARERKSPDVRENYVEQMNEAFRKLNRLCQKNLAPNVEEARYTYSDTLRLGVWVTQKTLHMGLISVRPCMEGYGTLTIVIYQLLKLAYKHGKTYVRVHSCYPKTLAVLQRKFEPLGIFMADPTDDAKAPDCYLDCSQRQVTASELGIQDRIIERTQSSVIKFKPELLPTAEQLNDAEYVENYFNRKNGFGVEEKKRQKTRPS